MILRHFKYLLLFAAFLFASCKWSDGEDGEIISRRDRLVKLSVDGSLPKEIRRAYTDSIYEEVVSDKNDSVTRYYLSAAAGGYYDLSDYDRSIKIGHKVYKLASRANDSLDVARALYLLGASHYGNSNPDSALFYYRASEKTFMSLKVPNPRGQGQAILYKAYVYYDAGEYVLSETEAFKALKLLEVSDSPLNIYNCYNLIATSLDGQNNNPESIRYYELGMAELKNFKKIGFTDDAIDFYRASNYNNMGGVYLKTKDYEKAITIFEKALAFKNVKDSPNLYAKLLNNLASARYKSGIDNGVENLFFKSLAIRDSIENEPGIVASNYSLGEYYLSEKDTQKAVNYLSKSYGLAREINSNNDILISLKRLSDIDKKNNHFYLTRYIAVNDSLQELARATRNKFARIEYDTERIISEKEALAKRNSFIIGVSVVVLLFVAAIFIIYYLNSRNKELLLIQEQQKANEEIYELMFEQQGKIEAAKTEEKSRIAMELHDGILNNIYAVRLNLEFINKKADDESVTRRKEYIKELQNVESEIRGVSHDLSRNALFNQEQSFENILAFMITSQKNTFDTEFEAEIDSDINWSDISNVFKVNIYRIIQEALQNINKYSKAATAKVRVLREAESIRVMITDNGIGFDPEKAKGGIGLKNLRKRTDAIHGELKIVSEPDKGTMIEVAFPLQLIA